MARAFGSYPKGHWFKSNYRYQIWPVGQVVKTRPFHGCNMGSNPVRVTTWKFSSAGRASALQAEGHRFEPCNFHQKKKDTIRCLFSFPKIKRNLREALQVLKFDSNTCRAFLPCIYALTAKNSSISLFSDTP